MSLIILFFDEKICVFNEMKDSGCDPDEGFASVTFLSVYSQA